MSRVIDLLYLLGIVIAMFSSGRILMYFENQSNFGYFDVSEILSALFNGLIYDVSLVLLLNSFFILFFLLPLKRYNSNSYVRFLKIYYVLINSIALLINLLDIKFFTVFHKRMNWGSLTNEIHSSFEHMESINLGELSADYWLVLVIWFIMLAVLSQALWFIRERFTEHRFAPIINKSTAFAGFLLILIYSGLTFFNTQNQITRLYLKSDRNLIPLLINNPQLMLLTAGGDYLKKDKDWYLEEYNPEKKYELIENQSNQLVRIFLISNCENFEPEIKESQPIKTVYLSSIQVNNKNIFRYLDEILLGIPPVLKTEFHQSVYSLENTASILDMMAEMNYQARLLSYGYDKKTVKRIKNFYGFRKHEMLEKPNQLLFEPKSNGTKKIQNRFDFYLISLQDNVNLTINQIIDNIKANCTDSTQMESLNLVYLVSNEGKNPGVILKNSMVYIYNSMQADIDSQSTMVSQPLDAIPSILHYINYPKGFISYGSSVFSHEKKIILSGADGVDFMLYQYDLILEISENKPANLKQLKKSTFVPILGDSLIVEKTRMEATIQAMINDFRQRLYHGELEGE